MQQPGPVIRARIHLQTTSYIIAYLHIHKKDYVRDVNLPVAWEKKFTPLNRIDKPHGVNHLPHLVGSTDFISMVISVTTIKSMTHHTEDDSSYKWNDYWNDMQKLVIQFDLHTPFVCDEMSDPEHNDHSIIHIDHSLMMHIGVSFLRRISLMTQCSLLRKRSRVYLIYSHSSSWVIQGL